MLNHLNLVGTLDLKLSTKNPQRGGLFGVNYLQAVYSII